MRKNDFIYIAGPCVIESEDICFRICEQLRDICLRFDSIELIFKASFDKANRTSVDSYRGTGLIKGLELLKNIKERFSVKVLTDIHTPDQAEKVAEVVDIIQIPAFLSRQTDLLVEAGKTGRVINIKKAQFMAPEDMIHAVKKVESTGNHNIMLTERGTCLGYHNLVVDFRSFDTMKTFGYPVIFDATHSVQIPSKGGVSSGNREYVLPLARAAAAYGIDGLFTETHIDPLQAKSDAANLIPIESVEIMLRQVMYMREGL